MSWNYAELSKLAKKAGGPEQLMTQVKNASEAAGRMQGRMDMMPFVGIGVGLGTGLGMLLMKLYGYYKGKKEISLEEANKAEIEIIEGIKNYDLSQSDEACLENDEESLNDELCTDFNNQETEEVGDETKIQSEDDI